MVSTKLLRLPSRGALGNGLRVVAGAVLASEGSLVVMARILRETGFEDQVAAAIADIEKPSAPDLTRGIKKLFQQEKDREWRDHIKHVADLKSRDVK